MNRFRDHEKKQWIETVQGTRRTVFLPIEHLLSECASRNSKFQRKVSKIRNRWQGPSAARRCPPTIGREALPPFNNGIFSFSRRVSPPGVTEGGGQSPRFGSSADSQPAGGNPPQSHPNFRSTGCGRKSEIHFKLAASAGMGGIVEVAGSARYSQNNQQATGGRNFTAGASPCNVQTSKGVLNSRSFLLNASRESWGDSSLPEAEGDQIRASLSKGSVLILKPFLFPISTGWGSFAPVFSSTGFAPPWSFAGSLTFDSQSPFEKEKRRGSPPGGRKELLGSSLDHPHRKGVGGKTESLSKAFSRESTTRGAAFGPARDFFGSLSSSRPTWLSHRGARGPSAAGPRVEEFQLGREGGEIVGKVAEGLNQRVGVASAVQRSEETFLASLPRRGDLRGRSPPSSRNLLTFLFLVFWRQSLAGEVSSDSNFFLQQPPSSLPIGPGLGTLGGEARPPESPRRAKIHIHQTLLKFKFPFFGEARGGPSAAASKFANRGAGLANWRAFPFFILFYVFSVGFRGLTLKFPLEESQLRLAADRFNNGIDVALMRAFRTSFSEKNGSADLATFSRTQEEGTYNGWPAPPLRSMSIHSPQFVFREEGHLASPEKSHLVLEKHFLRLSHLSTQLFVFWTIQTLGAQNNFGRNNPPGGLKKDQKSTQARILWPKKRKTFWSWVGELISNTFVNEAQLALRGSAPGWSPAVEPPSSNRTGSSELRGGGAEGRPPPSPLRSTNFPDLPGIQELSPLIQVLIESLGNQRGRGRFIATRGGGLRPRPPQKGVVGGATAFQPSPPKGYLFVGPPGTGKTLLAQEIAHAAKVPFICVSASEIQKQIEIGTRIGALRLRKLFEQARTLSPCILFFDEIDAIAGLRSQEAGAFGGHDSKLFTEFLVQMDSWGAPKSSRGVSGNKPVFSAEPPHSVLLGTTNFLSRLDSAFVRSGRFDRILALTYPSKKIRLNILEFYINKNSGGRFAPQKGVPIRGGSKGEVLTRPSSATLNYFASSTEGFSQAHLARLVNESLLFSIYKGLQGKISPGWGEEAFRSTIEEHRSSTPPRGLRPTAFDLPQDTNRFLPGDPSAENSPECRKSSEFAKFKLSRRDSVNFPFPKGSLFSLAGGRRPPEPPMGGSSQNTLSHHTFESLLHGLSKMRTHRETVGESKLFLLGGEAV